MRRNRRRSRTSLARTAASLMSMSLAATHPPTLLQLAYKLAYGLKLSPSPIEGLTPSPVPHTPEVRPLLSVASQAGEITTR